MFGFPHLAGPCRRAHGLLPGPSTVPEPLSLRSHLFMVRLWLEPLGEDQSEWRGKVQHMPSGEAQYVRDWATLQAFLERKLSESGTVEEPLAPGHSE